MSIFDTLHRKPGDVSLYISFSFVCDAEAENYAAPMQFSSSKNVFYRLTAESSFFSYTNTWVCVSTGIRTM